MLDVPVCFAQEILQVLESDLYKATRLLHNYISLFNHILKGFLQAHFVPLIFRNFKAFSALCEFGTVIPHQQLYTGIWAPDPGMVF